MTNDGLQPVKKSLSAGRAILYGGIIVGVLDGLDAIIFFGLRGARVIRIFQSIAGGLLGRASFDGGLKTALLGVVLHFFIAFSIVSIYYLISTRLSILVRRPLICGPLYGVLVYFFMNLIVLPLSALGRPTFAWPVFANGLIIHALGVGLPSAVMSALGRKSEGGPGSLPEVSS